MNGDKTSNSKANEMIEDMTLAGQLAKCEKEKTRLIEEKNEIMKDFNMRMKVHLDEIRLLKDVNDKLQTDLDELRDLCCYIDDDRQKCRKLAKEWQNFGRRISSTLQSEVTSNHEEVNLLNAQQETIIAENLNLKGLCQDLEGKLNTGYSSPREYVCIQCSQKISLESKQQVVTKHSYSTSSPNNVINHTDTKSHHTTGKYTEKNCVFQDNSVFLSEGSVFSKDCSDQTIKLNARKKKVSFVEPDEVSESEDEKPKHVPVSPTESNGHKEHYRGILRNVVKKGHSRSVSSDSSMESDSSLTNINRAMQVLEIHKKLEEEKHIQEKPLKDREVAVLKEMCNVVWRKLSSDDPSSNKTAESHISPNVLNCTEDIIYEDLL